MALRAAYLYADPLALQPTLDLPSKVRGFVVDVTTWNRTLEADIAATGVRLNFSAATTCPGMSVCGTLPNCVDLCGEKNGPSAVPSGTPATAAGSALAYLPDTENLDATEQVVAASLFATPQERVSAFEELVNRRQFGSEAAACKASMARAWGYPEAGVGVLLDHIEHFLERSLSSGGFLAPSEDDISPWTTKVERCAGPNRGLNCYFNLSACSKAPVDVDGEILRMDLNPQVEAVKKSIQRGVLIPGFEDMGAFWTTAQLSGWVFNRMMPDLRRRVDAIAVDKNGRSIRELLKGRKYVGLHVRRGDACPMLPMARATELATADSPFVTDSGRFCPKRLDKTYGYWLKELNKRYGVDTVFMATDSEEATTWCTQMEGYTCHTISLNRTALAVKDDEGEVRDHFIERRLVGDDASIDSGSLFASAMADMELLANADYFVGVFAASMSRQAYQLMYYMHQHHRPFVSLDMHWAQRDGFIN